MARRWVGSRRSGRGIFRTPSRVYWLRRRRPAAVLGAPPVDQTITLAGIASAEAFGATSVVQVVTPAGIGSAEAFGATTVTPIGTILPTGIASAEALGTPNLQYNQTVAPSGIASAEAFGTATLVYVIAPTGITSAGAFGAAGLAYVITPTGLASGEAFGTATLIPGSVTVVAAGIPSAEGVGTPQLTVIVDISILTPTKQSRGTSYELLCVARIPQQSGPPTLIVVDPIEWSGLAWSDELSRPQRLDASVRITTLTDPVVQRLRSLATLPAELWLYRDGKLVFAGPWVGALAQGETLTLNAVGLLGYLRYRELRTDRIFTQVDQATIVKTLVDDSQARQFGHLGIDTADVTPSGVLRDARYLVVDRHNLAQRIEEMGRRENGFDLEVDPETRKLQLWSPQKGTDRSDGPDAIVFDARSITDTTVTFSIAPGDIATDVLAIGTSDKDTVTGTAGNAELRSKFGIADYTESFDGVSEQATIDDHAAGLLDVRDQALLVPGPNARIVADAALDAYGVGDTLAYQLHDVLDIRGAFRARKRTVTVSSAGDEKVSLEFA